MTSGFARLWVAAGEVAGRVYLVLVFISLGRLDFDGSGRQNRNHLIKRLAAASFDGFELESGLTINEGLQIHLANLFILRREVAVEPRLHRYAQRAFLVEELIKRADETALLAVVVDGIRFKNKLHLRLHPERSLHRSEIFDCNAHGVYDWGRLRRHY